MEFAIALVTARPCSSCSMRASTLTEINSLTRRVIGAAQVIVEVKAVAELAPIHEAQLLTYLRLSNRPVGLLINFNTKVLAHGVRRLLNGQLPP